jgi:adenylate cyclase
MGAMKDVNIQDAPTRPDSASLPHFAMRLRLSISTIFLALILPSFALFVAYIYNTNYQIYKSNAAELIITHNNQTTDNLAALLDPIADSLLTLAKQIQDKPALFENGGFNDTMLLHLDNNPKLVSIFTASDRGSFHQVQRMRENMVIANRVAPAAAKYNIWEVDRSGPAFAPPNSGIKAVKSNPTPGSAVTDTPKVNSVFSIYESWDNLLDRYVVPNNYDPRERPFYKGLMTKFDRLSDSDRRRYVLIDEPYISTSTKRPTINVSTPVIVNGQVRGMVGESFELDAISKFLKGIQISRNSVTYIIDAAGGILVATGPDGDQKIENGALVRQTLLDSKFPAVRLAFQQQGESKKSRFEINDQASGETYLAQFNEFPNSFKKDWQVLTLAPVGDFLEGLNAINRKLIIFGGAACILLVALTHLLSRTISRPIEVLTEEIRDLLEFKDRPTVRSNITEINILSDAVKKLRNTIFAFTSYVPRDLVNDLLKSGNAISLGGESRYLTIMFTDLQDFSSLAEVTPSRTLLKCVSSYLELVTYAVKEEAGTVDKFIGDAVMAFWGAPLLDPEHAYHACVTALKSQRRMVRLNEELAEAGLPPLVVRIGIHSDGVLVGNVGSRERMSYTVMGDGVNIAARLEGINKEFGTRTCISHATFKEAGELLWTRPIDMITVKGRKGELTIYELFGAKDAGDEVSASDRDRQLCELTQYAFQLFIKKSYAEAAAKYDLIAIEFDDRVACIMRDKCLERARQQGPVDA